MNSTKINFKNFRITPEFARLHAHVCGDGYTATTRTNRSKKELEQHPRRNIIRNRFHVRYCNENTVLLKQFVEDFKNVFNRIAVLIPSKNEIDVQAKWLYLLFKDLGVGKSNEWYIPSGIMNSSDAVKSQWLRAFFDDEGYITGNMVYLQIVNKRGIIQIRKLLKDLGIESKLYDPYIPKNRNHQVSYRIGIKNFNVIKFSKFVNFTHPRKKQQLYLLIKKLNGDTEI